MHACAPWSCSRVSQNKIQQVWFQEDQNPWIIQQFWFHCRPKSLENKAVWFHSRPKPLENTVVLVPQKSKAPENTVDLVLRGPKCLETHGGQRNQNPWNTTESLGLLLHLSTGLWHSMWARGGTLEVGRKEEIHI